MGFDYVNAFHNLKQTELGSVKSLPPDISVNANNPRVQEVKAIEVHFPDALARMITVTCVNKSIRNVGGVNINTGPIIGIVEWGVGGEFNRIEFNIPPGFVWRQNGDIGAPVQGLNGVNLAVPCSSIRVMGRNDALQAPANDPAATIGPNFIGQFGAFIGQGPICKPCGPLQRAYVVVSANGGSLAPAGNVAIGIPAFAKRVRFPRRSAVSNSMEAINVELTGDIAGSNYFENIAAGTQGQIELAPIFNTLIITNPATNVNAIVTLTAVFDLEL